MENIYNLVGKTIEEFQRLEEMLALIVYFCRLEKSKIAIDINKAKEKALIEFAKLDKKPLGEKLKKIEGLKFFEEENDIIVLNFLRDKRNYVAHNFFLKNTFNSESDIISRENELMDIRKWSKLINSALIRLLDAVINT